MRNPAGRFGFIATVAVFAALLQAQAQEAGPAPALEPTSMTDVFSQGGDGYPQTRIPAVVATPKGAILAFAEARQAGDHSENDIVLKRSIDGGATWQPLQIIAEMGGDSLNDPCAAVLPETGRVLLIYERYPKGYHTRKMAHTEAAETGYGGPRNTQTFITRSDDDGRTWSKPEDVTRSLRRPDVISLGSPGIGIQLKHGPHKGRILLPIYEVLPGGENRGWYNCAAISDDGGKTWRAGERVPQAADGADANECQIAELADGTIVMDARQSTGPCRKSAVSRDGGETWQPMYTVTDLEVTRCMGSILSISGQTLLASLPDSPEKRVNGTLFLSRDGGKTWPDKRVIYPGGFGYSCLTRLSENRVGCLFERDDCRFISFAVFDVESLIGPAQ